MWRCAAERAAHSGNFQGRRMFQAGFKPMMWLNLPAVFPPSARLIGVLKTVTASPPRCSTEEIKHKRNRNRREVSCAWNGNKATSANLFLLHVLFSSTLQKDKPCFSLFIHNKTGDEPSAEHLFKPFLSETGALQSFAVLSTWTNLFILYLCCLVAKEKEK